MLLIYGVNNIGRQAFLNSKKNAKTLKFLQKKYLDKIRVVEQGLRDKLHDFV